MESTAKISEEPSSLILTSGASGRVNALLSLRALKSLFILLNGFLLLLLFPFRRQKRYISGRMEKLNDEKPEISHRKAGPVLRVQAAMVLRSNAVVAVDQDVAVRRALAIGRVKQDTDGNSVREFSVFVTERGETLFVQSWTPVSVKVRNLQTHRCLFCPCFQISSLPLLSTTDIRILSSPSLTQSIPCYWGLVVLLHGLNEHSGRYDNFAKQLNANGYKVYGMDWIGHGGSDGLHAYVHSLDDAVSDTKSFLEKVLAENPGFPCFFFGHSTGAAIILKAVLDQKIKALIEGMVLTSPAIRVQPAHPIFGVLAPIFSFLLPRYQFSAANKQGSLVSRDPEALVTKYSDPLVYTGSIRIRTGSEILRISSYLQQNLGKITIPFLVLHGTADTVTDSEASQKLYEEASSTDKSIKLYEGFLHDLLFEPEREAITKDIIDWLNFKLKV
ncbi:uncharacterized protein LOC143877834 isoform X1 [Tasmannia lanceolata]|uniref:uncharacterized protein LOC143877834 isoform X1 n=1 Tax=Tasmannia lanceolata TaxID=3420 RepID=UPI004063F93E